MSTASILRQIESAIADTDVSEDAMRANATQAPPGEPRVCIWGWVTLLEAVPRVVGATPELIGRHLAVAVEFGNGFTASIAPDTSIDYAGRGLYQLAILNASGELVYDTPITGDVLNGLDDDGVVGTLLRISALRPRIEA
jgi:hypothetical protein